MKRALLVVDVQNDFCPGGALAVPEGDAIAPIINSLMGKFDEVITTQDWHPENHCSFVDNGGQWPKHCVEYTEGAKLHQLLDVFETWSILKGQNPDKESYSGFNGTDLDMLLCDHQIDSVYICGLATDYCVKATALDSVRYHYETFVIVDACRGVNLKINDDQRALHFMTENGIHLVESEEVPCPK